MAWLKEYWWLILVVLVGTVLSAIKDLSRVDHTKYLNRPKTPTKNNADSNDNDPEK